MDALNCLGVFMFVAIGIPLMLVMQSLGYESEGAFMIVLGVMVGAADLSLRRYFFGVGKWDRERGARFLGLPIWLLAVAWIVLGAVYLIRDA